MLQNAAIKAFEASLQAAFQADPKLKWVNRKRVSLLPEGKPAGGV